MNGLLYLVTIQYMPLNCWNTLRAFMLQHGA
nr:MAG TPA: hypothetical protein [Caudoviricetes sp.]